MPGATSSMLHTAEIVHWAALIVMGIVYTARLMWLFKFKAGVDRSEPSNQDNTNPQKAALYSLANVAMPWSMESTRQGYLFYLSFVIFHIGVTAGISIASERPPSRIRSKPIVAAAKSMLSPTAKLV